MYASKSNNYSTPFFSLNNYHLPFALCLLFDNFIKNVLKIA